MARDPLGIGHSSLVPIRVWMVDDRYMADVTPPHGDGTPWRSQAPMGVDALVNALRDLGCHQTDIGDAFYAADPEWLPRD